MLRRDANSPLSKQDDLWRVSRGTGTHNVYQGVDVEAAPLIIELLSGFENGNAGFTWVNFRFSDLKRLVAKQEPA